jgi:hypothetical protein
VSLVKGKTSVAESGFPKGDDFICDTLPLHFVSFGRYCCGEDVGTAEEGVYRRGLSQGESKVLVRRKLELMVNRPSNENIWQEQTRLRDVNRR